VLERPGSCEPFGGVAVIERRPYPAAAQTSEDCVVVKIPREPIVALTERHPDVIRASHKRLAAPGALILTRFWILAQQVPVLVISSLSRAARCVTGRTLTRFGAPSILASRFFELRVL
jgi:CRP-like cAMP-binding protein